METEAKQNKRRHFSAEQLTAQARSIGRRTTRAAFSDGVQSNTYTVLTHPLHREEIMPPYVAQIPKRMILPGLHTA